MVCIDGGVIVGELMVLALEWLWWPWTQTGVHVIDGDGGGVNVGELMVSALVWLWWPRTQTGDHVK